MIEFYHSYSNIIILSHIICAVIWLGSMIGYVVASYPSIKQIPNEKLLVRTSIRTLKRLYQMIIIISLVLGCTGLIMAVGASYESKNPVLSTIINTKEILWVFMFVNVLIAYYKVLKAKKKCMASDAAGARDNIRLISNYLIVINIFLGFVAAYFGMMLRN